jgi:hypothetical protein
LAGGLCEIGLAKTDTGTGKPCGKPMLEPRNRIVNLMPELETRTPEPENRAAKPMPEPARVEKTKLRA